ncbi:hypothetical protein SASPL_121389 [Salvia splendens]|uniref:Uncharacterized protein n=1 Tax=Salvia splendens TaxID=180675 RepID=A0A8X8ZUQ7_SALSN|nr:hypothetical protein SASPL_121389 [Salvia splendens]
MKLSRVDWNSVGRRSNWKDKRVSKQRRGWSSSHWLAPNTGDEHDRTEVGEGVEGRVDGGFEAVEIGERELIRDRRQVEVEIPVINSGPHLFRRTGGGGGAIVVVAALVPSQGLPRGEALVADGALVDSPSGAGEGCRRRGGASCSATSFVNFTDMKRVDLIKEIAAEFELIANRLSETEGGDSGVGGGAGAAASGGDREARAEADRAEECEAEDGDRQVAARRNHHPVWEFRLKIEFNYS